MAARTLHKLKQKTLENEKKPGRYADGGGLYLQVQEAVGRGVTKSWLFRYTRAGAAREMGLGPVHTIGLAEARIRAQNARLQLLDGIDPIAARDAAKAGILAASANSPTFKQCAEAYVRANRKTWRNDKHAGQWEQTLEDYAYPIMGGLPVAAVDTSHVLRVLEPIWTTKNETAMRLRGRIEKILDDAKVRRLRPEESLNPARWKGHLQLALPKISRAARIEHHAALAFDDAPAFLKVLREQEGVAPLALEFLILSAGRTGEVIGAKLPEIDRRAQVWTVPADRMKSKREHRVPLVDRAIEILDELEELRGDGEYLFPGRKAGEPLSNMALLSLLRRMKHEEITSHGFRSTFRDWASERTAFPNEVIEMALAHTIADKTEAAYRRGDLFEKRRKLMDAWAQFLTKPAASVTAIDAKRRSVSK